MNNIKIYGLTIAYVAVIIVIWQIGSCLFGELSGLAFGVAAFMISAGYMANKEQTDKSIGYAIMGCGIIALIIGLVAPLF